jgi:SAM-dependent methyltransferase
MSLFGTPQDHEVSDLVVAHDSRTLERVPVRKQELLSLFAHNPRAAAVVSRIPELDGFLDPVAVDRLLLRVHWEMQRLAEEFYHGARILELLEPAIATLRASGLRGPLRIVDVGCGTGYAIRWLAARGHLADQEVELTGIDLNSTLIAEARRLARAEDLPCQFFHGDAFSQDHGGHIYLSTGVLHHFRGPALVELFRRQESPSTAAFFHYDFQPSPLAPLGSWFFHILRMRTSLARHDGVLSAVRAHSAATLLAAGRCGAPGFACGIYGARIWRTPLPRAFHALLGVRRELAPALLARLGRRGQKLDGLR